MCQEIAALLSAKRTAHEELHNFYLSKRDNFEFGMGCANELDVLMPSPKSGGERACAQVRPHDGAAEQPGGVAKHGGSSARSGSS